MSALLEAALNYARRGWHVFPCEPGGKRPLARLAPNGCHSATTSEVVIRAWWADCPDANIGVATGEKSDLLVLDVDSEALENDTLLGLLFEHDPLPSTPSSVTGGGGAHHWFAYPATGRYGNTAGKVATGIDTRGEGGYVVAPPSVTDARYEWSDDPDFMLLAEPPAWLLELLADKPTDRPAMAPAPAVGDAYAKKAFEDEIAAVVSAQPGSRNSTLNTAAFSLGQLVGAGLLEAAQVEYALVNAGQVAGLPESEARATVKSGMRAGAREPRVVQPRRPEQPFEQKPAASNRAECAQEAVQALDRLSGDVASPEPRQRPSGTPPFTQPPASAELVSLADALSGYLESVEAAQQGGTAGVPTGLADLDRLTGGLKRGDLVILAARPSIGKSALAFNLARHAAGAGVGVVVFSLEMSAHQIAERLVAAEARVDSKRLREGYVDQAEWARVGEAIGVLEALPVWICDRAALALPDLVRIATAAVAEKHAGLVVVDYVGLVRVPGERDPRLQVKAASAALKALARDAGVPVLAISQLNRGVEARESHTPRLSDLRESGDLEQDADLVLLLAREEVHNPNTDRRGIADLIVAKNRNGPTGAIPLRWLPEQVRFADLEQYRVPDQYETEGF